MTARDAPEPLVRTADEEAEDATFLRWYGAWQPLDPAGVAALMQGFERPWWIVGGWSIDAFTGTAREHEDIDISILGCDIPAFRAHLGDRYTPWSVDSGTMRPLSDRFPEVLAVDGQIWVRADATSPWILDVPTSPDRDGLWVNKRDPGHVAPLDEVTWVAADGLRYLHPEITLLFKARLARPKDGRDLARTWPLLAPDRQEWLRETVRRLYPHHAWLGLL